MQKQKLEGYQLEGARFLAKRKHALLADDMGLGKTAQTILACNLVLSTSTLILCPASVKHHWRNEFKKWSIIHVEPDIVEGGKHVVNKYADVVIVNYDLIIKPEIFKQLKARKWDVLICDEAHYLKTIYSKRSKNVLGKLGIAHNANYKWMLTGTPIENRPIDLYPMLKVLNRKALGGFHEYESFIIRYCNGYYDAYTGLPMPDGSSNEEELKLKLDNFMIRRTLKDKLPVVTTQVIKMRKNIKITELEKGIKGQEKENYCYAPMEELGALASIRQEVALAKLPDAVSYITDVLKILDKLVVFAYHRAVINNLEAQLHKFKPVKYYGGMTAVQKEEVKTKFVENTECKVFIGQLKAAGTGLDGLQKVAHHMIFVEIDWNPFQQCIGRLRRKGQNKENVIVQLLVSKGSVEEQMLGTVKSKLKTINKVIGG